MPAYSFDELRNMFGGPGAAPGAIPPANAEAVGWVYWHRKTYVSATTLALSFFDASEADGVTNWQAAGQLPGNHWFLIHAPAFRINRDITNSASADDAGAVRDISRLINNGFVSLRVSSKDYIRQEPLYLFPPGVGILGFIDFKQASVGNQNIQIAAHGAPSPDLTHKRVFPIPIPQQTPVTYRVAWTSAQTLTGDVPIDALWYGTLFRLPQ